MVALWQYPCQPARCERATFRIVKGRAMTPTQEESGNALLLRASSRGRRRQSMAYPGQSSDSLAFYVLQCAMRMTTHCAPDRGGPHGGSTHSKTFHSEQSA
jgi:hypothetical protein